MSSPKRSPAEGVSTPVDGEAVVGALSPSRAADFMTCPLLYRFRSIDRLPEPISVDALRGTLVHKVLEDLYALPAPDRTPQRAADLLPEAWAGLIEQDPDIAEAVPVDTFSTWWSGCEQVLAKYFDLEDPRRLEPAEREFYVEALLESRLLLRGFIDRLDVAPDGRVRVVDYKTGRSPGEAYEAKALFQMRFYALAMWRSRGQIPAMLQLIYLGNSEVLRYAPDEHDLLATERKVEAIWKAITRSHETGDWRPSPSRMCDWCAHQALCPSFGGTPPPLPTRESDSGGDTED